MKNIDN